MGQSGTPGGGLGAPVASTGGRLHRVVRHHPYSVRVPTPSLSHIHASAVKRVSHFFSGGPDASGRQHKARRSRHSVRKSSSTFRMERV